METTPICKGGDPFCPCQDGDACHYVDMPGSPAMTISLEEWDGFDAIYLRSRLRESSKEIARLRSWLKWMSVDDTDAQRAMAGEPAPTVDA